MDKIPWAKIWAFLKANRNKLILLAGFLIYVIGAMLSGSLSPETGLQTIMRAVAALFNGGEIPIPGSG